MGFDQFGATADSTGRPTLMHYAISDSAWPAPSRMHREAPPAAGPTGTAGRARATPDLHGAVRSGSGPNRDHGPRAGRGSYASTHAHLGTAGRGTRKGTTGCERAGGAV